MGECIWSSAQEHQHITAAAPGRFSIRIDETVVIRQTSRRAREQAVN